MSARPFRALDAPLDGLNLIEASAGTGKTWTIAALYARLVLERALVPEQILVVTYTKAATAELRDRIRRRLAELAEALEQAGDAAAMAALAERDAHFLYPLVAGRAALGSEAAAADALRLRAAVSGFDTAAVFTIHGFCQRALGEHALAAGLELDRSFLADEAELLQAAADAAWKDETAHASRDWLDYLIDKRQTPEAWVALLRGWLALPELEIALPEGSADSDALLAGFAADHAALAARWHGAEGTDARNWLLAQSDAKLLDGRSHQRRYLDGALAFWDGWLAGPARAGVPVEKDGSLPGKVWRLFGDALADAAKGGPPVPPLFAALRPLAEQAQRLDAARKARLAATHARLIGELAARLAERKAAAGAMSFHDLLVELDAALAGPAGDALAAALRTRYRAALIDEFQDTDPLQFRIFDRLFGAAADAAPAVAAAAADAAADAAVAGEEMARGEDLFGGLAADDAAEGGGAPHATFLVGDPKQAIYAFRGAELHAYLAARDRVPLERRYSLTTNRRSTPALVGAIEQLFRCSAAPFLLEELDYAHVDAIDDKPALELDGTAQAALGWQWLAADDEAMLGRLAARAEAVRLTADRIAALLAPGRASLGGRPLGGGDVAVLAGTHGELAAMQLALAERGVLSVRISRQSVFDTDEARDLLQVLAALAEPGERAIRTALFTPTVGLDAATLAGLLRDERGWDATLADFRRWHGELLAHGPMAALTGWLIGSGSAARLAGRPQGERRLTNLLHLFELVEQAHHGQHGLAPLLAWYRAELGGAAAGEEDARLMRLESDASRVKLVTIHAAKGLEYPVVFCPFLWDGQLFRQHETIPLCHEDGRALLDFGSPRLAEHWQAASAERLAEKLRLLYVALTRPRSACYVAWGAVKDVQQSALGWLLAGGALRERDAAALQAEVSALVAASNGAMAWIDEGGERVPPAPPPAAAFEPSVATLARKLRWQWRMSSFSGLTAGLHAEAPDHDGAVLPAEEAAAPVEPPHADPYGFDRLPAGPRAGSACMRCSRSGISPAATGPRSRRCRRGCCASTASTRPWRRWRPSWSSGRWPRR
ncbi:UvrD-helicase domain-containing protein [Chitinimonas koreensis]|uniref:UvrD-helicase domain-containing protein n=1 Tax=Chitinimonas koreensis TaxID=356302 RepID=UPI0016546874|nr:UvrD-helicase domain-containing protein [Chitinimonas koreensis]QNM96508.1 UvrD-helicase domain-containing protein [Chitinimonas koreensis]